MDSWNNEMKIVIIEPIPPNQNHIALCYKCSWEIIVAIFASLHILRVPDQLLVQFYSYSVNRHHVSPARNAVFSLQTYFNPPPFYWKMPPCMLVCNTFHVWSLYYATCIWRLLREATSFLATFLCVTIPPFDVSKELLSGSFKIRGLYGDFEIPYSNFQKNRFNTVPRNDDENCHFRPMLGLSRAYLRFPAFPRGSCWRLKTNDGM